MTETITIDMDRETYNKHFMIKWQPVIDELKAQGKQIDNVVEDEEGFYQWLNRKQLRRYKKMTRNKVKFKKR